ncbi:MAG: phage late control D family protein, partial [Candidatus Binatia bacterium]
VKTVRAKVRDRAKAETVEVEEDSDDEGTADFTVKENFSTEAEAKKAAKSKAESLKAETVKTFVTVFGDPTIRAGAPFSYQNVRPEIDGIEFIIETATHRISKSGYMTDIEAKLKPVASKASKDKKKSTAASTSKTNGNSPKTPAVPDPKPQAPATSTTGGSPMGVGIGRA